MVSKRFEITVVDPISRAEFEWFEQNVCREGIDCSLTASGRILMVEGVEDIYELVGILSEHEFVHDLGLIKEIVDYEPQFDNEDMLISVDLNDN